MNTSENIPARRLILVSNRLPLKAGMKDGKKTFVESDGGLVSAIKSYFDKGDDRTTVEENIWVGVADFPQSRWDKHSKAQSGWSYKVEPIFVEEKTFNKFYNGFCNATIWPLFHFFPSYVDFESNTFESYQEVNRIFADRLREMIRPGDIVWIHDYHLMLLPEMIRQFAPNASIGFFLHIPFPAFDVFRLMHDNWKEKIIHGLLGADLIGFHTHEYVQHFLKTMRMVSGYDHRYREIHAKARVVKADLYPLGIDFEKFNSASSRQAVRDHKQSIAEKFGGQKVLFSVDRLDYTKGVTHRLSGFEKFLELYPEWRGKVVFIMVVVPSRQIVSKYNERRKLIEEQVGRINGKYSTLEWQPIIYRYSQLDFDELCALYQVAHAALITPLRDGMNLVAKEYVASRDEKDGVLILSEFAGAANELGEATMVNPTDRYEVARAIDTALKVPHAEQVRNMELMQARVREKDVHTWVGNFLDDLQATKQRQQEVLVREIDDQIVARIVGSFQNAQRRLLLLDYDGTITPIRSRPEEAIPEAKALELLQDLSSMQGTEVVVISGRNYEVLEGWLGHLPVSIVAEHGASIKLRGQSWKHHTDVDHGWKSMIRNTFELYTSRSPGSFIEEKQYTVAWHYRGMDPEQGFSRSREVLDILHHLIRNSHLSVLDGNRVIEVRAAGIDKGAATRRLLEWLPSDFVLAIGDDMTDEDIFQVLTGKAITVRIGSEMTAATYRASTQQQAVQLLLAISQADVLSQTS